MQTVLLKRTGELKVRFTSVNFPAAFSPEATSTRFSFADAEIFSSRRSSNIMMLFENAAQIFSQLLVTNLTEVNRASAYENALMAELFI